MRIVWTKDVRLEFASGPEDVRRFVGVKGEAADVPAEVAETAIGFGLAKASRTRGRRVEK